MRRRGCSFPWQEPEWSIAAVSAGRGWLVLLFLGLVLSSCAQAPPPQPSVDEQKRAFQALDTCLIDNAHMLDDGISEVQRTADAVLAACAQQQHTAIELYGQRLAPQDKPSYRERTQEATRQSAVQAVRTSRRAQGKHP